MPDSHYDLIIVGAGIVGLATAMEAVTRTPGLRLLILEKENRIAAHQSSHNSGVIHSGVYYQPGSLKARTCVEGAAAMIAFCRLHNVPHQLCGKVIIATTELEFPQLEQLYRRGIANGVQQLAMLDREQLRKIEPHCAGLRGLHVPGTGITDYGAVSRKFAEICSSLGAEIRTCAEVTGLHAGARETVVESSAGDFSTRRLINCAGLHADRISHLAGNHPDALIVPFRGEYYQLLPERQHLVRGLIYPVPDPQFPFLGVHLTRMVRGGVEAGPNAVLALKREGYSKTDFNLRDTFTTLTSLGFWRMASKYWKSGIQEVHRSASKAAFVRNLQKLVPELSSRDLSPGGSGVRAQMVGRNGRLVDDFMIAASRGMVHVLNVPSPAATASIVIGRKIVDMLEQAGA